jgi:hypothetical protein
MRFLFLLLLFVPCCPAQAQIALTEAKVQVVTGLVAPQLVGDSVIIQAESKPKFEAAALITVKSEQAYKSLILEADQIPTLEIGNLKPAGENRWLLQGSGKYLVTAIGFEPGFVKTRILVELGPTPAPPEPEPPGPTPDPTPTPTPDGEAPIPEPGFRVLIVYESADLANLPRWLGDADLAGYLDAKCVKGPKGVAEWRMLDQHISVAADMVLWAKALGRKRDSLPWLIVSNGKAGYEGPLPKTKPETMAILAKYAEAK